MWSVIEGDSRKVLTELEDNQFDSIVTDPPYNLEFMGKKWDSLGGPKGFQDWCYQWAVEAYRVLKPGGYILAFGGTRTYHRLVCALEDAGFEIRDSLHWIYGSGFPKSHNISKAIDKAAGAEREVIGKLKAPAGNKPGGASYNMSVVGMPIEADITAPATDAAKQWDGWGTALKPAHEPIVVAMKPLAEKTFAKNVVNYGTGGLHIDACRVGFMNNSDKATVQNATWYGSKNDILGKLHDNGEIHSGKDSTPDSGRWPPNILLTHSPTCGDSCALDCPIAQIDGQSGVTTSVGGSRGGKRDLFEGLNAQPDVKPGFGDTDGASRFYPCFTWDESDLFFYCTKASKKERPVVEGLKGHATVKPLKLIRWLVKLVTPPGGTVLDLFGGTGTTAEACLLEGFNCLLIENDPKSILRIEKRMEKYGSSN